MGKERRNMEFIAGKVRKRGCSSSSSSSSMLHNVKLKRAILARKQQSGLNGGGYNTPVPSWKMMIPSQTPKAQAQDQVSPYQASHASRASVPVSARKLAASLWEFHEMPAVADEDARQKRPKKSSRNSAPKVLPRHLSDPSHSPSSLTTDRSGTGSLRRQIAILAQKNTNSRKFGGSLQPVQSPSNTSSMEIQNREQVYTPTSSLLRQRLRSGEPSYNLTTSAELLRILNRIWNLEEQSTASVSLASALRAELEYAHARVQELMQEQRVDRDQIDKLTKKLTEQKSIFRSKEQEKVLAAIESLKTELEGEKKLRKRLESLNKKSSRELEDTKGQLAKALQDLERERKARELMEEVCDELAREIGQDKAKVEELKRESAKVWEEVEEERKMLQMAEIWREERVQMKLAEARLELEEKNATLDKLRKELETFLRAKRANDITSDTQNHGSSKEREGLSDSVAMNEDKDEPEDMEEDDDSGDSDLHSIELNRETLEDNTKAFRWSYASGTRPEETKSRRSEQRVSLDECAKDWRSSEQNDTIEDQLEITKAPRGKKSLLDKKDSKIDDRKKERFPAENEWDFTSSSQWIERSIEPWDDYKDHEKIAKNASSGLARGEIDFQLECDSSKQKQDYKARKLKAVSNGREHIFGFANGSSSPTRQWTHQCNPSEPGSARLGRTKSISEWSKGVQEKSAKGKLLDARMEGHHAHSGSRRSYEFH